MSGKSLKIRTPDDFHLHLRDGAVLAAVAPLSAATFARALIMPNLQPPVRTLADASAYRSRILSTIPPTSSFQPLMTLYLTDETSPADISAAAASGIVVAAKLYPAGATTNSSAGVTRLSNITSALHAMEAAGMVLCIHGEVTRDEDGADVDVFDREAAFVRDVLPGLLSAHPQLRIVLEHVTTAEAAELVQATPGRRLAATITAHHLLYSRGALFAGAKVHPHMFCLPVLKRERHRRALLAAVKADARGVFFAGTDSAPHLRSRKLCASGCAGIFTAGWAAEFYAEAFEEAGCLEKLEGFLSENGARFYGIGLNEGAVELVRATEEEMEKECGGTVVPEVIAVAEEEEEGGLEGSDPIVPLRAGERLRWSVKTVKK